MESHNRTTSAKPEILGVTRSERYLLQLAHRTFLSLWSHNNLFTDEGRKAGKGDGKELCDLVVIFDNHVILFSDKHCAFPNHTDIEIAWGRWYRRAIEKSVNQLFGAEAWFRRFPDRVFLDSKCSRQFPFQIPDIKDAQFHRIAVTRGAHDNCRNYFGGNSTGSLTINTEIQGSDHLLNPFSIGHVAPDRGYVHVFDELTLEVVMRELDTIYDLVSYLQKKEELLSRPGRMVMATGEEQLVAMYLTNVNKNNKHDFIDIADDLDLVGFGEGYWEDLVNHPQYKAKKQADQISYTWDRLIEHFIKYSGAVPGESPTNVEPALRVLASESRLSRRQLASYLLDAMKKKVKPGHRFTRLGMSEQSPDTAYLFLIFPKPNYAKSDEEYRVGRRELLLACCKVAKLRASNARRMVGIATEPLGTPKPTEDLVLLETFGDNWTPTHEKEARELQKQLAILTDKSVTFRETHDKEYPDISDIRTQPALNRAERRRLEKAAKYRRKR